LREVSIETVVPLGELLAFYQDDLAALAGLSLAELRATVADYKAHRADYQRLSSRRFKPMPQLAEAASEQSIVAKVAA
jgi:hypothetical protein